MSLVITSCELSIESDFQQSIWEIYGINVYFKRLKTRFIEYKTQTDKIVIKDKLLLHMP